MQSTSSVLIGELRHYQRLMPFTLVAIANALPLMIFAAFKPLNVDLGSHELVILPQALIPFTAFIIGLAVITAQGPVSRLYLKPLSNHQITSLFFFAGAVLTGLGIAASIGSWNLLFDLKWSLLRPALLGVLCWAAIHPSLRISIVSPVRVLETIAVVVLLWFAAFKFGLLSFHGENRSLSTTIQVDFLPAVVVVLGGYWLSLRRIAKDRSGQTPTYFVDLFRNLQTWWDQRQIEAKTVAWNPQRAYESFEWRLRSIPFFFTIAIALVFIVLLGTIHLLTSPQPLSRTMLDMASGLPSLLFFHAIVAGLIGFLTPMFNDESIPGPNPNELSEIRQRIGMGEFCATLPITDLAMAKAALRSIAKCLLISLGILVALSLIVVTLAGWSETLAEYRLTIQQKLPTLILIGVVSSWAAMSGGTALGYYSARQPKLPLAFVAIGISLMFLPLVRSWFVVAALTISAVLLVGYHFARCYREQLIKARHLFACGLCLAAFACWGWFVFPADLPGEVYFLSLLLPLAAIWPIASLPLAIRACRRG